MTRRLFAFLILLLIACSAWSQTLGLRSTKTKLQQIDTDTVRIIFADGMEARAQRVAHIIHRMAREYPIAGNDKLRKISIILQNETDIPNGYVGLAPWRSEFYVSPPTGNFGLGSLPWTDLLSIHEFRHVQQRSASRTGLSAAGYYLFGEEFFSGIVNVSWPNWYTEGDAVIFETALSNQGRGRLPSFLNGYREKVLSDKNWNYHKARNGSFKDFVPNHYNLGFLMQNYGRAKYGQDFWDEVALQSASYKGLIYPFSAAVKRVSGESTPNFYKSAMAHYRSLWKIDAPALAPNSERVINVDHKRFENHSYPIFDKSGNLYVVIESYDHISAIYKYDMATMDRHKVTNPGFTDESTISVAAGKICWAEYRLDSRWERVDFSTIILYDEKKKKKKTLTKRQSYFAPALSEDGKKIAALYDDDFQNYKLHILDASTGSVITELPNPNNYYYSFPQWSHNQDAIVSAVRDTTGQMAIAVQFIDGGEAKIITDWSFRPIGRPAIFGEWIYFTQSETTVDQIFRVHIESGDVQKVLANAHSTYQPVINPSDGSLFYTEYSNDGNRLVKINSDDLSPFNISSKESNGPHLTLISGEGDILNSTSQKTYGTKKYSAFAHPVTIHSWRPVFDDPILGFEFRSLNVLQSIRWTTGFQWNSNDNSYGPYTELAFGMWYPEILLGYTGWKRTFTRENDGRVFNWFENGVNLGLRIPFKGLHGPFSYSGAFTSRINRITTSGDVDFALNFISQQFNFSHRLRQAPKHPITRFGQAVQLSIPLSISEDTAFQVQIKTDFTFPSLRNHVIWLQYDYRYEPSESTFLFGDSFNYSRGYSAVRSNQIYRLGINYQLPLIYPDWGFGGLVYFKRIRANLFTDLSTLSTDDIQTSMNSAGAELIFDMRILNVETFTFGLRWSHQLKDNLSDPTVTWGNRFEIFVPVIRI
jgi:Tol biopolymer transport system component